MAKYEGVSTFIVHDTLERVFVVCVCSAGSRNNVHLGAKGRGKGYNTSTCNDPTGAKGSRKKRQPPAWTGIHKPSGEKLKLVIRQDRHQLMVLLQEGRHLLCNRIDTCGVIADC